MNERINLTQENTTKSDPRTREDSESLISGTSGSNSTRSLSHEEESSFSPSNYPSTTQASLQQDTLNIPNPNQYSVRRSTTPRKGGAQDIPDPANCSKTGAGLLKSPNPNNQKKIKFIFEGKKKKEEKSKGLVKKIICGVVITALIGFLVYYFFIRKKGSGKGNGFIGFLESIIKNILASRFGYLYAVGIMMIYLVCGIPGASIFVIILSYQMNKFWEPLILTIIARTLSSSVIYFLVRKCCLDFVKRRFRKNIFFRFVLKEGAERPWTMGVLIRFLSFEPTIKDILVVLGDISFWKYIITLFPQAILFSLMYCFVGFNLKNVDELIHPENFSKMSLSGKVSLIFSYGMMLFTFLLIVFICFYTRSRIDEVRKEIEKEDEMKLWEEYGGVIDLEAPEGSEVDPKDREEEGEGLGSK